MIDKLEEGTKGISNDKANIEGEVQPLWWFFQQGGDDEASGIV